MLSRMLKFFGLTKKGLLKIILGCAIMAFAVVNVHKQSGVTEGGVLGMMLFLNKIFGFDQSITSVILDVSCYVLGFSIMGFDFVKKAFVATISFAAFAKFFNIIGPVLPSMYDVPLLASIVGGICIGLGCGLVVSEGGAAGGDDALAMTISTKSGLKISLAYLFSDITVLALSLIYIPVDRIMFSLLTTVISSFLLGQFEVELPNPEIKRAKQAISKA